MYIAIAYISPTSGNLQTQAENLSEHWETFKGTKTRNPNLRKAPNEHREAFPVLGSLQMNAGKLSHFGKLSRHEKERFRAPGKTKFNKNKLSKLSEMKEILKSTLHSARNAEHFQFHADVLSVLTAEVAQAQNIGALRETYASFFADENTAFIQNQAYEATKEIEEKDRVRDDLFLYIKQSIESDLRCPLADKKAAAVKLEFALTPYRSANSRPYAENTAQITNFVDDMQSTEYATFVGKLGLTEAIAQLKTANDDFNAIYAGRSGEKLTRVSADNMKAIRPKVDDAYRAVVSAINALYQVNELVTRTPATSASLGKLIDSINALGIQLQQTLSHRGAGTKAKAPGGNPETPDPNPGDGEVEDPTV